MSQSNAYVTRSQTDQFSRLINSFSRYPLLKPHEEVELGTRVQVWRQLVNLRQTLTDDQICAFCLAFNPDLEITPNDLRTIERDGSRARDKMILSNQRLVFSMVLKIYKLKSNTKPPILDLFQEGCAGLSRAVDKFDPTLGYKFSTYATWWVRQAVTRAIHDQSRMIRLPIHLNEALTRIDKSAKRFISIYKRFPSIEELAEESGFPAAKVKNTLDADALTNSCPSLNRIISPSQSSGRDDTELCDLIQSSDLTPDDAVDLVLRRELIDDVLATLDYKERTVLELRFGLDGSEFRTLEQVGAELNLSRERIRQIQTKALRKLRTAKVKHKLSTLMEVG